MTKIELFERRAKEMRTGSYWCHVDGKEIEWGEELPINAIQCEDCGEYVHEECVGDVWPGVCKPCTSAYSEHVVNA